MTQQIELMLRFDWGAGPFWVSVDQSISDDYSVEDITEVIAVSEVLLAEIAAWNQRYQQTFDHADPASSGIADPEKQKQWVDEGLQLARRLKYEVGPAVQVTYVPLGGQESIISA
ncbi:hypothetical protein B1813_12895 [Saccharomonospora piscinae]|uniref:Uncharacterized protein n=1 Tax=Saccharomonospora piscinae TaxID=687388 RepID=A0A1V9A789_SACPI|nr:hypothetical protein [Saccharomonospora piscinae]OQO92999.1 hypothetical protein B1813_12895 [Saccharomonospora piscinae]